VVQASSLRTALNCDAGFQPATFRVLLLIAPETELFIDIEISSKKEPRKSEDFAAKCVLLVSVYDA
jgi:hypothetical protein